MKSPTEIVRELIRLGRRTQGEIEGQKDQEKSAKSRSDC